MRTTVRFLSVQDVILIHADTIEHEGGLAGIRDHGLLESAVMMSREQFDQAYLHRTLAEQAAAYLFHICRNHPFNDGNKRTAVMAALMFLNVNSVDSLPKSGALEKLTMACAASKIDKSEVTAFFREHMRKAKRRTKRGRRKGEDRRGD